MQSKVNSYAGKRALVIGMGISGRSAAKYLMDRSANVIGVDKNSVLLEKDDAIKTLCQKGLELLPDSADLSLQGIDLVVVSPGVPSNHHLYAKAKAADLEIIGEVELACRDIKKPFLAITGTNGKTTVTLLVAHVLNFHGKSALALGNVGTPLTAELGAGSNHEFIVAELSSYQLETMHSQIIDVGVILNVTPDHLDRYPSMQDYARAKFLMKNCMKPQGDLFIEEETLKKFGNLLEGFSAKTYGYHPSSDIFTDKERVYCNQKVEYILPLGYRGCISHDIENLMAAFALCRWAGITGEQFIQAAESFKKPPHRIEFVDKIDGVQYYDDSKGTNIDAVIRAVESLSGKIKLIAGGVDKGASYEPWLSFFEGKVTGIYAIGQAAPKMQKELSHKMRVEIYESLESAVRQAAKEAHEGEIILLSPGCSSFDMFRDYAHRGDEFKRIVQELKNKS